MRIGGFLAGAVALSAMWATGASALADVQARGGWASSLDDFPFAIDVPSDAVLHADYGNGAFGELDVAVDVLGFGIEAGADFALLDEATHSGGPLDNDCGTGADPILGLIDDCFDRVTVDVDTQVITADLLLTKEFALIPKLRLAFGATGLFLDSEIDSENIFIGGTENVVDRDTSLDAYGVKAGLEHSLPIMNTGLSLNTEVYGAWVWGERTVDIFDQETINGAPSGDDAALFVDDIDVPVLDAAASLSYKVSPVISLEVGGKYRKLFGAMFTADTINPGSGIGGDSEDLDYWAVFGGVTFSL